MQRIPPEDESATLMSLLFVGARNPVYNRSLVAAATLMRAI